MKLIIIGGTGFIGRHVVAGLCAAGHEIAVVHRGHTPLPVREGVTEMPGDRSTIKEMRNQFHAWLPDVAVDMILSNAAQARATVEAFRGIVGRVVAVSSCDVYRAMAVLHRLDDGPPEPVPPTEDAALRTQAETYSPEALAMARASFPWIGEEYDKVQVEEAIRSDPGLASTILRLPMVYGPGDPLHRLYPVVKRIEDRRPVILQEDSYARWIPCRGYVENVARAIALAATSDRAAGRVYSIGEPDRYTEAEWTAKVGAVAGWRGRVLPLSRDRVPRHLVLPYNFEQHLFTDSTRIRSELGYREPIAVEEALRRTVDWEKANPPQSTDPAQYDYAAEDEAVARLKDWA